MNKQLINQKRFYNLHAIGGLSNSLQKYEDDLKKGIMNYFKRENIIHKMSILIPNIRVVILKKAIPFPFKKEVERETEEGRIRQKNREFFEQQTRKL